MTVQRVAAALLGALMLMLSATAFAQPRAWIDRDRITLAETVTLHIESTAPGEPDYAPLQRQFTVSGHTGQRRFELVNGRASMRHRYSVSLQPRSAGLQQIPALAAGGGRTAPIRLFVTADLPRMPARAGDDVFIESEADDTDPYVQQAVGWVVRLYSAVPLVSGQLDQAAPDGASLQRVGEDVQYLRQVGRRQYSVVERRYLLVPERSGELALPGAVFEGRGAVGFFDSLFNRDGVLRARAAPRFLRVRPMPADAPQPWLPLRGLTLRYLDVPSTLKTGVPATLVVELVADGATAVQLVEASLPTVDGLQVLAEPPGASERFVDGRPRASIVRRYALVPGRSGAVNIPAVRLPWFDVRAGRPRVAALPALHWQVQPGRRDAAPAGAPEPATAQPNNMARTEDRMRDWLFIALALGAMATSAWAWRHRVRRARLPAARPTTGVSATVPARSIDLAHAIDTGDLRDVEQALLATIVPAARDLDELAHRFDDPTCREAIVALQRARWAGGDIAIARRLLRTAFAGRTRSRPSPRAARDPLPPLYPDAPG